MTYSSQNRSAACRVPYGAGEKATRIEMRFPDSTACPYLAFAAMMLAGLDGIKDKTVPVGPLNEDLFELSQTEIAQRGIPQMPHTLREALEGLSEDCDFLKPVFTDEFIGAYLDYKFEREVIPDEGRPTAYEFKTTYQC